MTVAPLTPLGPLGLALCGTVEDFTNGALHQWPEQFCKGEGSVSWAPLALWRAPLGKLQAIIRLSCRAWGGTNSVAECHKVRLAPMNTFKVSNLMKLKVI